MAATRRRGQYHTGRRPEGGEIQVRSRIRTTNYVAEKEKERQETPASHAASDGRAWPLAAFLFSMSTLFRSSALSFRSIWPGSFVGLSPLVVSFRCRCLACPRFLRRSLTFVSSSPPIPLDPTPLFFHSLSPRPRALHRSSPSFSRPLLPIRFLSFVSVLCCYSYAPPLFSSSPSCRPDDCGSLPAGTRQSERQMRCAARPMYLSQDEPIGTWIAARPPATLQVPYGARQVLYTCSTRPAGCLTGRDPGLANQIARLCLFLPTMGRYVRST